MIVAGLELTRLTRMPSARSTPHAWAPEESNSQGLPMTTGPGPMTSTDLRSSRLGTAGTPPPGPLHQGAERVELPGRVVRAGGRLRVVLHAERGHVKQPQSLHHAVVEVHVTDL